MNTSNSTLTESASAGSEKRRAARILLIESEASVANICLRALNHERLEVRHVESPFGAWQQLEEWRPQFYLVGDDFADCLGIELVGQLRAKTNAPIVLVTTTDSVGYLSNVLEAGADDVLVRPILPPLLLAKVQAHLRRAYRYSVPPVVSRAASQPRGLSAAPVPPEVAAPATSFGKWPRCESCGYIGPRERFEGLDENGRRVVACPACMNNRVRFPI